MSFTLKQIKGAVVEKKLVPVGDDLQVGFGIGFNNAIDAQSSIRLRFNREKLYNAIQQGILEYEKMDWHGDMERNACIIDAIIAADKDIIEVEK